MVGMGEHDELENRYMPKFEALVSERGLVVEYRRDRAGIDTGLHLFARESRVTRTGHEQSYWKAMASRVWFQLKGVHESTITAEHFQTAESVPVSVEVGHLKYWFAAPEPVYLVVYVESVDRFLGIDVRELVEARWGEGFYAAMRQVTSSTITVRIPTTYILDAGRIAALAEHRSMRIDGPAFRGRPLGHRLDPLRSVLAAPDPDVWQGLVTRLLAAHDFAEDSSHRVGQLSILQGVLGQTLLWQSPAFAEYGYSAGDRYRIEPEPEQLFGFVTAIVDSAESRNSFTHEELVAVRESSDLAVQNEAGMAVIFRGRNLSGTGGLWRSTLRETTFSQSGAFPRQIGLEALSYLVLVSTLVYLDFAPELSWAHVNYLP